MENIFDEFRKAISRAENLAYEIDNGDERHIKLMEIFTIDLVMKIAEIISYCDWANRDEEVRQEDIITTLDIYNHELLKTLHT